MSSQEETPPPTTKTCPSCAATLGGAYCAECGENADFEPISFSAWLGRTWASFAGLDSRVLNTVRPLLFRPGFLTQEYLQGRRVGYTKPLRLYILVSALSIAVMSFFGALSLDAWTRGADESITHALGIEDGDDPDFLAKFDKRLNIVFPVVNLFSPLLFSVLLKVLYRRTFFEAHLVFSLHYFTFFVLVGLIPLLAARIAPSTGTAAFLGVACAMTLYLALAQKRVYDGTWRRHILRLLILLLGIVCISQALGILTLVITNVTI